MFNLPTSLTIIRIFAVPVLVLAYYIPGYGHLLAAIIFVLACITDWLDGYLARNLSLTTRFGAFLDPVADKLIIAVALVLVVGQNIVPYLAIPAAIIVGREIVISSLREWMAEIGKRTSVTVSRVGKVKTFIQMIAVGLLLFYTPDLNRYFLVLGVVALYVAAVLTLWSMIVYLKLAWPDFRSE